MADTSNVNPYEPSSTAHVSTREAQAADPDGGDDWRGNLRLTSNIMRIVSIIAALGGLASLLQITVGFRIHGTLNGWTWWHTLLVYRAVYIPCWLFVAFSLWRYSRTLGEFAKGNLSLAMMIEKQAKTWLAVALLVGVMLMGVAMSFGGSLSAAVPK